MLRIATFTVILTLLSTGCAYLQPKEQSPELKVHLNWVRPTTESRSITSNQNPMSPILLENLLIQGNSIDGISAYSRTDGREIWRLDLKGGISGNATAINDRIFFGASDGIFYSLEATTGRVIWTLPIRADFLASPLLHNGTLYFLTGSNTLYSVDAATGSQNWVYPRQDTSGFSIRGGSQPVFHNGVLYVGFSDGVFVALNAADGQVLWERKLNSNQKFRDIDSNPIIDNNKLYLAGFDDALYALDLQSGQVLWRYAQGGFGGIQMRGNLLYYATTDQRVLAIDKRKGSLVWEFKVDGGIASTPSLADSMLIVTASSGGSLYFLNAEKGSELYRYSPGLGSFSSPAIDLDKQELFFISQGANLYAFNWKWRAHKDLFPKLHGGSSRGDN